MPDQCSLVCVGTGHTYYVNLKLGTTQWEKPDGFKGAESKTLQTEAVVVETWYAKHDENGNGYYVNQAGVSQWDKPDALKTEEEKRQRQEPVEQQLPVGPWVVQVTAEGNEYFYNTETQVTQWEEPPEMNPHWHLCATAEGVDYFYNAFSGESKWPAEFSPYSYMRGQERIIPSAMEQGNSAGKA